MSQQPKAQDAKLVTAQDYLQKAGSVSMEYLGIFKNKLATTVVDTVYAAESITKTVMPGNPVTREYEVTRHIGSAGPGLLWKMYAGYKKTTKQEATVFVLQKKSLDHYTKKDRDLIIDAFKKGATQLARLKHPRILSLQHQLEESKESLAFATEPCFCSLANALGNHENMPTPLPEELVNYKLFEVEIKYGLMQMAEGLSFIHKDCKILHRNICPESIILNSNSAWKIAGFELYASNNNDPNDSLKFPFKEWDGSIPYILNQPLEYLAPEYGIANKCDCSSDMFSYGMLFFTVFNEGKTLYKCELSYSKFVSCVEDLRKITNIQMSAIPSDVREYLKMLLHINSELRPDAGQVMKIPFFDDVAVKTLEYLDSSFQVDNLQKSVFFKSLPQIIDKLPQRVCLQRIIPCLETEFINPEMIPFLLPSMFLIAEQASNEEYVRHILPRLKIVFKLQKPLQIILIVLRNMNLILSKTPPTDVKEHILPMVCRALEADTLEINELCLSSLPSFAHMLDAQSIKHQVIPRIRKICLESGSIGLRVSSLVCIGKLLENLEKWIVLDDILPILEKINVRDSAVLMAMLGIYRIVFTHPKLGITKDLLATKVLPFLIPISIDSNLNIRQCTAYMALIKDMLNQIETEHKKKMEQIEALEREKSIIPYTFASVSGTAPKPQETPKASNTMMDQLMLGYGVNKPMNGTPPPGYAGDAVMTENSSSASNGKKELTLKDKQEMAARMEKEEAATRPVANSMSMSNMNNKNRDLMTDNLVSRNLADMTLKKPPPSSTSNFDLLTQISPNSNTSNSMAMPQVNNQFQQQQRMPSAFNSNSGGNSFNNNSGFNSFSANNNMMRAGNNQNGSEFVGVFGNLALPAPPSAMAAASTNSNAPMGSMGGGMTGLNVNTSMKSNTMSIPLIPTPPKQSGGHMMPNSNSQSGVKKSAMDDLSDIFG